MKKIRISIENPCHENWDNMTPETQGRFCNSCEKIVMDFTSMSDSEILQFFAQPKTEKICGRFNTEQLTQEIQKNTKTPNSNYIPIQPINYGLKPPQQLLHFAYILVVVLGIGVTSCQSETTKGEIRVKPITLDTSNKSTQDSFHNPNQNKPRTEPIPLMGDTIAVILDDIKGKVKVKRIEKIEPQIMGEITSECIVPFEYDNPNP